MGVSAISWSQALHKRDWVRGYLPHMHTCMIQTVIIVPPPLCVQPLPPGLSYLCDSVDQTVISVRPLVCAAPPPSPGLSYLCDSVDQTVISVRPLVCVQPLPLACHTCVTLLTRQSSAYVPLCVQGRRSKRGSLAMRRATLNFDPSFSSSAMTQSVIQGVPTTVK